MLRHIRTEIRALRAAIECGPRFRSGRRIEIPDVDDRLNYSPGELAALEAQAQASRDAAAAAGEGWRRIYVPPV
jgi:hypothetical protein